MKNIKEWNILYKQRYYGSCLVNDAVCVYYELRMSYLNMHGGSEETR